MIDIPLLIQSFREIIGWPYQSPGSNSEKGIDCSGAFVRGYRQQGQSIYHGSNTIFRQYCSQTGAIGNGTLLPGMAVFKQRSDGKEPSRYRGDGIGNLYHMGLVCSVNPLQIIHATTPKAKMDTKIGNWSHWGRLSAIDYTGETQEPQAPGEAYPTLRKGAKGESVTQLQVLLISAGYPLPKYGADGSFGSETVQAVMDFQRGNGLKADGVCGPDTWEALLKTPVQTLFTVTIQSLTQAQAKEVTEKYGGVITKQ